MKEKFVNLQQYKLLTVSQGLTGKMSGMPAVTSSMLCNENCQALMNIKGSVCEKCYTRKYLTARPNSEKCYRENTDLLSSSIIPTKQLPFINAALCRLESFGDITNATHLHNYINLIRKNNHCTFSLFTKNYAMVLSYFKEHKQPRNLSIVFSSLMLNTPFDIAPIQQLGLTNVKIFTVYTRKYADKNGITITCGKNRCIDCQKCYKKNKAPIYISELLK